MSDIAKPLKTRDFACKEDAELEIKKLKDKKLSKIKYHDITLAIVEKKPEDLVIQARIQKRIKFKCLFL